MRQKWHGSEWKGRWDMIWGLEGGKAVFNNWEKQIYETEIIFF